MSKLEKMDSPCPKMESFPIAFLIVRNNVLANPNLYGGRYTQTDIREAYDEWKEDVNWEKNND